MNENMPQCTLTCEIEKIGSVPATNVKMGFDGILPVGTRSRAWGRGHEVVGKRPGPGKAAMLSVRLAEMRKVNQLPDLPVPASLCYEILELDAREDGLRFTC